MDPSYVARVEGLLTELGVSDQFQRVNDNTWTFTKDDTAVAVAVVNDYLVVTAPIADGPPEAERENFYLSLLAAQAEMFGTFFTVESGYQIRINQVWPIDWLQGQELAFIVGNVSRRAAKWAKKVALMIQAKPATE